ncbi:putative membrane protein [Citrus sinensis]|uniref:Membrane protein n=1 Tax=Citrus sinensis TaxID=2711 RepID=A0ACB8JEH5_CITSI|nr:putative membrane protein [Citrus sinensis]
MGSRYPSHQLSNGLFVSGRPEQPKEKAPTMSSVAMPYTGGDIKKSGELGKMFDIPMDSAKSRKSGPITGAPSRTGSFAGAATHSGSIPNAAGRAGYNVSGPISSGGPGSGSMKKTNSGPLNKHGEPIKKSSGPQSGGATRQNSGPIPPSLPATGLITSGPISSGPLNSSGAPRKLSGSLDSSGSIKMNSSSIAQNQAVTTITQEDDYSFRKNFPKPVLWLVILIFVMGFIAGGFILGAVHNPILLIVVLVLFAVIAAIFIWNTCWGRKAITDFISCHPDTDLRTAKSGQFVKVTGVLSLPNHLVVTKRTSSFAASLMNYIRRPRILGLTESNRSCLITFSATVLHVQIGKRVLAVVTCGNVPLESSFRRVPRCVYTSTSLYEYRAWGSKPANPKHRHFTWGLRSLERHVVDFYISDFQSGLRALVKTGSGARVTPFVDDSVVIDIKPENKDLSPEFIRWLGQKSLSSDDRLMRLKEGYIKEGSTVSVMGIVQRNDNVLMIVPPPEPIATGWQWTKCIFPASLEGIILRCEDTSNNDVIPV